MKLEDWLLRFYFPIVDEFGYSVSDDAESARILEEVGELYSRNVLEKFRGKTAIIIGNGPNPDFSSVISSRIDRKENVVITAGKAILRYEGRVDIHVTDLDEGYDAVCRAADRAILVVHAHGDNIDMVREFVPSLGRVIGTTQYIPFGRVYNFGGFTDGDRAAIIAKAFAEEVRLVNFNFSRAESETKLRKLKWARRILEFEGLL